MVNRITIPRLLVEPTIRLVCLRLVLITIVAALYCNIRAQERDASIIFGLTLVHHLASALGPVLVPILFTWTDLLLIAGEISHCIFRLVDPQHRLSGDVATYLSDLIPTILLGCLLLLKVIHVLDTRGATLLLPTDILASQGVGGSGAPIAPWKYFVRVIVGVRLWKRILPGEGLWVAILRGLVAMAAMLAILAFAVIMILFEPLAEAKGYLALTREYRTQGAFEGWDLPRSSKPIVLNLIVDITVGETSVEMLRDMVTLTALSPQNWEGEPCQTTEIREEWSGLIFQCSSRKYTQTEDELNSFRTLNAFETPDLFLSVNFSGSPFDRPLGSRQIVFESPKVYLAFTDDIRVVRATTRPTLLLPGLNLIGVVNPVIRRRFRDTSSSLGVFNVYDTFAIADIDSTVVMSAQANPNISTFQITFSNNWNREWRVVQDYRENSILDRFSAVGGLGSFFSLLCAVVFGTGLFSIIFRTKPYSAFGILHGLESQRQGLAKAWRSEYPKLEAELRAFQTMENRGVLALLLDTLLDLDLVKEELATLQPLLARDARGNLDQGEMQESLLNSARAAPSENLPDGERDSRLNA